MRGVQLSWKMPVLDKELDTVFNLSGGSRLFFYKDITLYQKEGVFQHEDGKEEKTYTYWIYKQNRKLGLKFEASVKDSLGIPFKVDSFLVKNAFTNFPFFSKDNDSIVFKRTIKSHEELLEKYVPKIKPDDSYPDTMIFRFSKNYTDIPFSYSHEMENEREKRLIEITGVYNPIKNPKYKAQLKGRKISFLMEKILVKDKKEKIAYFERFEKHISENP
ncbi:MAG: hypothetical protein V4541_10430 [Bacteroidota bacterium]